MSGPTDFLYNNARHLFATGQLNWPAAAVNAMLVSSGYAPSTGDQYVSAIPPSAIIVRDVALTSLSESNGICAGSIPMFNSLISVYPVAAIVLYVKGVSDSVSPLIYYSSTGPGFPFAVTGFNYFVGFDLSAGGWFQV